MNKNIDFYLNNGFKVFPIKKGGKTPALKGSWKKHGTKDKVKISSWVKKGYNLAGIVPDGIIIIDADEKNGGFKSLQNLGLNYTNTTVVASPNGYHIYYNFKDIKSLEGLRQTTNTLGPGVDIRIKGGYIVVAGSTRPDGDYDFLYEQGIKKLEDQ